MIHKAIRHTLIFSTLAFIAAIAISGCSSSTNSTPPPTTTSNNVSPKTGSSYSYSTYTTDSTNKKVPGSDNNYTAIVLADSLKIFGQTNVYEILDRLDSEYFTYAANNDWMVYLQNSGIHGTFQSVGDGIFHRWITLGTSSKATGVIILDTSMTLTISGFPIPTKVHLVSDYIGDSSITVGSETLTAHHCRITASATSNTVLITPAATYTNQRDLYFVSKLGFVAKETTFETIPAISLLGNSATADGTYTILTSYSLK